MSKKFWIICGLIVIAMVVVGFAVYSSAYYSDQAISSTNTLQGSSNWATPAWPAPASTWYSGAWATPTPTPTWYYRKPITITNPGSALSNCPLQLVVPFVAGHMNANFNDVRFTNSTGTLLSYWIESYTASTSAVIWVNVTTVAATGTPTLIYLYYGNWAASTTTSNQANVTSAFTLFQDFETDTTGWTATGSGTGSLTRPSGTGDQGTTYSMLLHETTGTYGAYLSYSVSNLTAAYNIEFSAKPSQSSAIWEMQVANALGTIGPRTSFYSNGHMEYYNGGWLDFSTPFPATPPYSTTSYYTIKFSNIDVTSDTYDFYVNYNKLNSTAIAFNNVLANFRRFYILDSTTSGTPAIYIDQVKWWPYTTYTIGTEQ